MKFQQELALAWFICSIWSQKIPCDGLSDTLNLNNWTCACITKYHGNQSKVLPPNCSSSCNCSSAGGSSENRWTCICAADGFPKVGADDDATSCFTACNCSSGSSSEVESTKKRISSKHLVIILLLCVFITTLAFVAALLCYMYRRDKVPIQRPVFSSDKETSFGSAANLISHRAASVPESGVYWHSPVHSVTSCIYNASSLFKSKAGKLHGTIIQFSYTELEVATNKFSDSNLIGVGGSSLVYLGHLRDGRTVAVKRIKTCGGPDAESVFLTEIKLISRLHHCHVVPLLGYCSEYQGKQAEWLLVFEYMPNGNLRDCLDGALGKCLDWSTRVAVALGAARGLEYLHEAAAPRILHRDVKSTNVLLDEDWRAKITDLGMAQQIRSDGTPSCSSSPARMQGTFGYFAPEYAIVGKASLKSDVFSFGVILLELITGRQPIHKSANKGDESLVIWATPRLQDCRIVTAELPDLRLKGHYPAEEMQLMAYLAKECLLLDPDCRPTMSEVVQILSTIAPKKSKRRNFAVNISQSLSSSAIRNEPDTGRPDNQVQYHAEELKPAQLSMPGNIDCTITVEKNVNEADINSAEYIKRSILLTSNDRTLHPQDDEVVDLTEPWFESFCMVNVQR